jgi:TonB family protein
MKTRLFSTFPTSKVSLLHAAFALLISLTVSCTNKPVSRADSAAADDSIYIAVDSLPVFSGGDQALLDFIASNTKYPEEAKAKNITGRVIVKFAVGKDGSVSMISVERGVDPLLDTEAIRVIGSLPRFEKPAINRGTPVSVWYMVPITFSLR